MKGFSREFILILGIALCVEWTNIVNGQIVSNRTLAEEPSDRLDTPTPTKCPPLTCPRTTCPPLTCPPTTCPPLSCPPTSCPPPTCPPTTCPPLTCPPTTCPPLTCPPTTCPPPTCPKTTCPPLTCPPTKRPSLTCDECPTISGKYPNSDLCRGCTIVCMDYTTDAPVTTDVGTTTNCGGSSRDLNGQDTQPTEGDGVMPIVIASVVSFIAGIGVCLLVLCLIGHFHGRICLKFTDSSKYVEKPEKQTQMKMKTASGIDVTEHEYLDLRIDTMPNPNKKSQYPSEITPSAGQKQSNMTTHHPVYETMTNEKKDHVYSGLGSSESNPPKLYEHTTPNRSSEHVYSGLANDTDSSDQITRHQPLSFNTSGGNSYANIQIEQHDYTNGNPVPETCDNQVEANDYLVLEKEQHSTDHPKPEPGPHLDDAETAADNDDYHAYHMLHKL